MRWRIRPSFPHLLHNPESNKYPPAEPEVLRLLAPQRGLIATGQSQKQDLVSYRPARVFVIGVKRTPGFVELLLPPRQSRGISLRISQMLMDALLKWFED